MHQISLRRFEPAHLPLLARWLNEPHVARWYADPAADLAWAAGPPPGGAQAMIAADSRAIGYLRWQIVGRAALDALGLHQIPAGSADADILLSAAGVGRGVGPAALRALAAQLQEDASIPAIGLTTEPANSHAHSAFAKAGFRLVCDYDAPRLGRCHLMLLELRSAPGQGAAGGGVEPALAY